MNNEVVIFGASDGGKNYFNKIGCEENIVAFCDNDPNKHGLRIQGIPIISVETLKDFSFSQIVIASEYASEIVGQLKSIGISPKYMRLAPPQKDHEEVRIINKSGTRESETSKCRSSLARFCKGNGLDVGYGGDPIVPTAICVDLHNPYAHYKSHPQHLHGDGSNLHWFASDCLDYVYSSHVLEDFIDTEEVLREWSRVLKPGGKMVLFLPDEKTYREHCAVNGNEPNKHHVHKEFSLNYLKNTVELIGGLKVIHESFPVAEYSFEFVLEKSII